MKYLILSVSLITFFGSCKQVPKEAETQETVEKTTNIENEHDGHTHSNSEETEGQRVFFVGIEDGDVLTSPFTVEFGVEGMEVEPAGQIVAHHGHHHLLINHDATPSGEVIPAGDATKLHFGKGQTSTEVTLEPGEYKLTMQFANGAHASYGKMMSTSINITVEIAAQ